MKSSPVCSSMREKGDVRMATFRVRILDEIQEPVLGERVVLEFIKPAHGMSSDEHTDSGGFVEFSGYEPGEGNIFIHGSRFGPYKFQDGGEITIKLDSRTLKTPMRKSA